MRFSELNLAPDLLASLQAMGFEDLTPIQEATYPLIMSGRDVCALAETGSGKTAACAIPLIQKVDPSLNAIQGLVIVPTRELCLQYVHAIGDMAKKTKVVSFAAFGGVSKSIQASQIDHELHILVATPGRLIDLMMDGVVKLKHVKCVILDEADELLTVGFFDDIKFILSCIRQDHQTLLFSATMKEDIKTLAHDCMKDPQHISLIRERAAPVSIEHQFLYLSSREKEKEALKILRREEVRQCLIFCNARHRADKIFHLLKRQLDAVDYIHAGLAQEKRSMIFKRFKKEKIRYLIATDVAGRGLDFSHVTHVLNWDFPAGIEQYTHRTGRVGRMGRQGHAVTLITKDDLKNLRDVMRVKKIVPQWLGQDPLASKPKNNPTNH